MTASPSLRAFTSNQSAKLVHAKINISEPKSEPIAQHFRIRAVPSYILVEPNTGQALHRQVGGSPNANKILAAMQRFHDDRMDTSP